MSWKEIMMAINSDIRTPLNKLIERVLDKLDNISTGGGTGSSGTSKPFYTSGFEKNIISPNPSVSLPYNFYRGSAVVYNNEIHIMGGGYRTYTYHYKWDGTSWTSVSTLPYDFLNGSAVVYNNEIHIMGGTNQVVRHYKWDGTSWTFVGSSLPFGLQGGSAVVFNNEIHILGSVFKNSSSTYYTAHYKWDGTSWTEVSTLPYNFYYGSAVVYNNEIHILGTYYSSTYYTKHYKWDGTSWTEVSTLPYDFYFGSAVVFNNEIHILGSDNSSYRTKHYNCDGTSWTSVSTLPYDFYNGSAVVYNDEIRILGGYYGSNNGYDYHYKLVNKCIFKIYLPSGFIIYFYDIYNNNRLISVTEKQNCIKQSDNSLLVNSDGLVEFEIRYFGDIDDIKYYIF